MKYEARKTAFSKIILLIIVGVFELIFLYGLYFTNLQDSAALTIGIVGLTLCATFGIIYTGIESLLTLYRDLNTKQSYMLFMTPNSSYKILGAKAIENAIAIAVTSIFFAALAAIDLTLLGMKTGDIQEIFHILSQMFSVNIDLKEIGWYTLFSFFASVTSWFLSIMIGYLAITLSSSVLAGKKFNGIVCFGLYLVLSGVLNRLTFFLSDTLAPTNIALMLRLCITIFIALAMSVVLYVITGTIMEKKLSV